MMSPKEAVRVAADLLDPNKNGDHSVAIATFAAAILTSGGLKTVAQAIDTYDKNEQDRALIARGFGPPIPPA